MLECDGVIHSAGILLDSQTVLGAQTSDPTKYEKSYEQMNRDTALVPAKVLLDEDDPKTFVFISAERGLPIAPRYLSTKREVEDFLI